MWRQRPTGRRILAQWPRHKFPVRFSSSFAPHETISLTNGQTGAQLTLDIHHPTTAPPPSSNVPPTILIYLPRGPFMSDEAHDASTISLLRSSLPWTIVQVNYDRLMGSPDGRYPAPIHNVLAGYDWCHEHLLPKRSITRPGRSQHVGRVVVCGELVGGGLASMLALTECHAGQPGVVAAALNNPLLDWVDLNKGSASSSERASTSSLVMPSNSSPSPKTDLLSLRSKLFRKPEQYFDPFASPILFFRSAGVDVPPPTPEPPVDDLEHLMLLEREEFFREQQALSAFSNQAPSPPLGFDAIRETKPRRKAKSSKRFPSAALKLRLPQFHISATSSKPVSVFESQLLEFNKQLRLSHARQSGQSAASFGVKASEEDEIDEVNEVDAAVNRKIQMVMYRPDTGAQQPLTLWDDTSNGRGRVMEVVKWLKETLL